MQAGEETVAHVIDLGNYQVRAGFSGEESPRYVNPSWYHGTVPPMFDTIRRYNTAFLPLRDGLFPAAASETESIFSALCTHIFDQRLRSFSAETPLLITGSGSLVNDPANREALAKIAFEQLRVPALFFARSAVLTAFSSGKSSALVVESGHEQTVVTPVVDGFSLTKSEVVIREGGQAISERVRDTIVKNKVGGDAGLAELKPLYEAKGLVPATASAADGILQQSPKSIHPTYRKWAVDRIFDEMKEVTCAVSKERFDPSLQPAGSVTTKPFELPDGRVIDVGVERFAVLEPFIGSALPDAIVEAIGKCDRDQQKEMYQSIVLSGGNTIWGEIQGRLQLELAARQAIVSKPRIGGLPPTDRRFAAWMGGSILASLGTFQQMWISRTDYEEHGVGIIHKNCP